MTADIGRLEQAYEFLGRAASEGKRCPMRDSLPPGTNRHIRDLARQGIIEIQISGHNYRTIKILTGPYAGMTTKPDPSGQRVWRVIGTHDLINGERRG